VTCATAFFLDSGSVRLTITDWLNSSRAENTQTSHENQNQNKVGGASRESKCQSEAEESLVYLWNSSHTFIFLDPSFINIIFGCLPEKNFNEIIIINGFLTCD